MGKDYVIGIDGGGTYTRVVIADLEGNVAGAFTGGGSHPGKNKDAKTNVQHAVLEAVKQAGKDISVKYIVGGFAGLDQPEDQHWADDFLNIDGINAPFSAVNDAEIAQYGAFLGKSGIVAVAGTGSNILGRTENGRIVKEGNFHHKSKAGARHLSYSVIYDIITAKSFIKEDEQFIHSILEHLDLKNVSELRKFASDGFYADYFMTMKKLSKMGRIVTDEAHMGNKIAISACRKAANSLTTGILLVSSVFSEEKVPFTLIGSVATNSFIANVIMEELEKRDIFKELVYQPPKLRPEMGAVLKTYHRLGLKITEEVINKLEKPQ